MMAYNMMEEAPMWAAIFTYVNFIVLYAFGVLRDLLRFLKIEKRKGAADNAQELHSFTNDSLFNVDGSGTIEFTLLTLSIITFYDERFTGTTRDVLNLGSYNYLGFAQNNGRCIEDVVKNIQEFGIGQSSSYVEVGKTRLHRVMEERVANFIGTEDALVFGMGFATNSTNIPCLIGKGCLVLSDEFNHASIVLGCRLSGAKVQVYRHCDVVDLENKLRNAIIHGQPKTGRPWKKIMIVVEGIYSMEGTICPLPEIIALKKKYKAYLYLDEAHSIGAIGAKGKGVVEYYKCSVDDVDIMMGTFTKSFSSCGGYIAGKKKIISYIRRNSHAAFYAVSMSPPIMQQVISVIDILEGKAEGNEGYNRISQLAWNTKYFRKALMDMGFIVYGNPHSPVVPVMLFSTSKIAAFNRELLKRGIAVVTVGFPATPLTLSRVRFCLSASHTKEMLDKTLNAVKEIGNLLNLRVSRNGIRKTAGIENGLVVSRNGFKQLDKEKTIHIRANESP